MDNTQRIIFNFPVRGITENAGYGNVPEGFALDFLNVVSFDVLEGRLRGGKRPGTGRAIRDAVDTEGTPIQCMQQVTLDSAEFIDAAGFFDDPFFDIGSGPTCEGPGGGWAFPPPSIITLPELPFVPVRGDPELIYPASPDEPAMSVPLDTATPDNFAEEFSYANGELGAVSGGNWDASGFLYQAFSVVGGFATLAGFTATLGAGESVSANWVLASNGGNLPAFNFGSEFLLQAAMSVPAGSVTSYVHLQLGNLVMRLSGLNGANTLTVVCPGISGGSAAVELPNGGDGRMHTLGLMWRPTERKFYVWWNYRLLTTIDVPTGGPSFSFPNTHAISAAILDGNFDSRGAKIRIGDIRFYGTV
jgi:hypothetical protein